MNIETYKELEAYMRSHMNDSAHDCLHVYRVLYLALDIAEYEADTDTEALITACLLHDIGRQKQFKNPELCHAVVGGEMAYEYLIQQNHSEEKARHVRACIKSHRYRASNPPESIEAKILFDADKIDVSGAVGIARTLLYKGHECEPLYLVDENNCISDATGDTAEISFFQEYNFKLKNLYSGFFTKRGSEIAGQRRAAAEHFYDNLLNEVKTTHEIGLKYLERSII